MPIRKPYATFDFDLAKAVGDQLLTAFNELAIGSLNSTVLAKMRKEQGVYHLYERNELRYVGKTDNLRERLIRHELALNARHGINANEIGFKALYIHRNWTTWTTEKMMIEHFGVNGTIPWNSSGYGSNDPGRKRDHTAENGTFNDLYPINIDKPCIGLEPGTSSAFDALRNLSSKLPYTLRFQRVTTHSKSRADHDAEAELKSTTVEIRTAPTSVREVFLGIVSQLGPGWQATKLKGRLILYKEDAKYVHGEVLCRT